MKPAIIIYFFIVLIFRCYAGCGPRAIKWKFGNTSMNPVDAEYRINYVQGSKYDTILVVCDVNYGCPGEWICDSLVRNNVKNSISHQGVLVNGFWLDAFAFGCSEGTYRVFFTNTNWNADFVGRVIYFTVSPVNYVGVSELYTSNSFLEVYPNPASKDISILNSNNQILEIDLANPLGNQVLTSYPKSNEIKLNVEELPKGIYYLTAILEDKKRVNKKIIVE